MLAGLEAGKAPPILLVRGDLVVAEPSARRIAEALAARVGVEVHAVRRSPDLGGVIQDLRTFSLFDSGKVVLVIESAILADRSAAASLIDEVAAVLPVDPEVELSSKQLGAASRLFQVVRLFGSDPRAGSSEAVLSQLPDWVYQGGKTTRGRRGSRGRGKKQVAELREGLAVLLEAGRAADVHGWAASDAAELASLVTDGLPEGHHLVMAESSVAKDHPVAATLAGQGAIILLDQVDVDRKGEFGGLEAVAAELERETEVSIDSAALRELARRTLRRSSERGSGGEVNPETTARLAAEYRKLATLAEGKTIDVALVRDVVEDRGEEDVWKLLDALGEGRADEALARLRRLLLSAEDPVAARLSVFSLIASFLRQLVAVQGMAQLQGVAFGERNYNRFKDGVAPKLQEAFPDGTTNPLSGLHPFRLFRVYGAAARVARQDLTRLLWRVLETETRLKGDSGDPETAMAQLVAAAAVIGRRRARR